METLTDVLTSASATSLAGSEHVLIDWSAFACPSSDCTHNARYLDQVGVANFVDTMQRFEEKYGKHFTPCPLLVDYAKTNKKFHN